jgi:hypothetical protein
LNENLKEADSLDLFLRTNWNADGVISGTQLDIYN